jgi:alginate O-acetyltransferase complex protein AlgJ
MIFYPNSLHSRDINVENIYETLKIIEDYNDFFNARGVDFIFMPIPDKETIHSQELPPELKEYQNYTGYLSRLYTELDNRQIKTIKLYGPFIEAKEVFQLDDTHWNGEGVQIAVKETLIVVENLTKIEESP